MTGGRPYAVSLLSTSLFSKSINGHENDKFEFKSLKPTRVRGSIYLVKKETVTKDEIKTSRNGESWHVLTLKDVEQITERAK